MGKKETLISGKQRSVFITFIKNNYPKIQLGISASDKNEGGLEPLLGFTWSRASLERSHLAFCSGHNSFTKHDARGNLQKQQIKKHLAHLETSAFHFCVAGEALPSLLVWPNHCHCYSKWRESLTEQHIAVNTHQGI